MRTTHHTPFGSPDRRPEAGSARVGARPRWGGSRRRGLVAAALLVAVGGVTAMATGAGGASPRAGAQSPGTLIGDTPVSAPGVRGSAYLVSYWSQTYQLAPVDVTGIVYVPQGTAPAGGWPVVSFAHATDGMNSSCAPSLDPSSDVPDINSLLRQGWEVVATDYQGEENPALAAAAGLQPHGVNLPTAYDVINIVRAAVQLPAADASTRYVVWGYSQGGSAALFAQNIASSYAPDLTLEGAVSTAPAANFVFDFFGPETQAASPFTLMYVAAYNATYGATAAPLQLTGLGTNLYNDLSQDCYSQLAATMAPYQVDQVFTTNMPTFFFAILLASNDPLYFIQKPASAPVLLVQGLTDTTDSPIDTWVLGAHLCAIGQDTLYWGYPGLDHGSIVDASMNDIVHWIGDRFAGGPDPDPYTPNGGAGIQQMACG